MALQTATIICGLALALLGRMPDLQPVRALCQDTASAALVRRALPFIILLPLGVCGLFILGRNALWFDRGMGIALLALALVALLCLLLWWSAAHVARHESLSSQTQSRLQSLLSLMPTAVYTCDADGRINFYNPKAAQLWGRIPKLNDNQEKFCAVYKCWFEDQLTTPEKTPMAAAVREGKAFRGLEAIIERPDGTKIPVMVNIDPLFDAEGKLAGAINVFQDITPIKQAEAELRTRQQQLQAIVENTPECVKLVGPDGTLLAMNRSGLCMLEADSTQDVLGKNVYDVVAPESRELFRAMNERVCAGSREHLEFDIVGFKGTRRRMETTAVPIPDPVSGGTVQLAVTRDITARKQAEDTLRLSEERFRLATFSEAITLYEQDSDLRYTWLYPLHPEHLQAIGKTDVDILGAEEGGVLSRLKHEVLTSGHSQRQEVKATIPGGVRHYQLLISPRRNPAGKIIGVAGAALDITDRKRIEEALRVNQSHLESELDDTRLLQDLSATLIYENDIHVLYKKTLDAAVRIMRSEMGTMQMYDPKEDALRLLAWHGFGPGFGDAFKWVRPETKTSCSLARQLGSRAIVPDIETSDFFMGDPALERLRAAGIGASQSTPLYSRTGQLVGMISTHWAQPQEPTERDLRMLDILARQAADLLERRQADAALQESEEKYRTLFDSIEQGFCAIEVLFDKNEKPVDYRFLLVNPAFERQTGIPNAVGRLMREIAPLHEEYWFEIYGKIALTGEAIRFENRAEQLGRHYEVYAWRIGEAAECKVGILFHDITERKRGEEIASRLAAIVEHSEDAIFSTDLDGAIRSWNRGAERLYGYSADEVIGRHIAILVPEGHDDEQPQIFQRIRQGEAVENYETVRCRKDGSLFHVSLTVSPVKDAQGNVIGVSKVARDITEKVRAREILEKTVAQRTASLEQALAQMEDFNYSISHDLRAPARAVRGIAQAAVEDYGDTMPAELRGFLGQISTAAERMDQLIRDILDYSRVSRAEVKLAPVQLDQLIPAIIIERPEMQPQRAEINIRAPLDPVLAHEPSLYQAIANLLANAVKFVPCGATPKVQLWTERSNGSVRLWVADNGIGVNPKYHHRLFNVFERAHNSPHYEGTGIGLAIVRKAAEKMGGKVGVVSDGVSGSSFWIELPAAPL